MCEVCSTKPLEEPCSSIATLLPQERSHRNEMSVTVLYSLIYFMSNNASNLTERHARWQMVEGRWLHVSRLQNMERLSPLLFPPHTPVIPMTEPLRLFDGHNDVLLALTHPRDGIARSFFDESAHGHLDLPRAVRGGFGGGFFAMFTPPTGVSQQNAARTSRRRSLSRAPQNSSMK